MRLFHTQQLTIGYQVNKPLQTNINIEVHSGQVVSLMGQNGVGKTTFLKTMSHLLPALGGEAFFNERPLDQLSHHELSKKLSLVLTERPSSGNLTVHELIASGRYPFTNWLGRLTAKDQELIEWAITETQINYIADKKLGQLSDGQLQKVMIARALAQETPIIFLDEPTAHLDLHNKIEIMMLLKQIAAQGKGILISTHDLQISLQLSDKMWLFNFNAPVIEGIPEDLILNGSVEKTLFLEEFGYDFKTGQFKTNSNDTQKEVLLHGDEEQVFWTRHALEKNGYKITESERAPAVLALKEHWKLETLEKETLTFPTIENLIQHLV